MKILNKVKDFFKFDDDIDLSRRKVIKTVGALAALTAVGGAVPLLSKVNELKKQIVDGQVYGQIFYITEPVIIDIPNVSIYGCRFIAVNDMSHMLELGKNAKHCLIKDCVFDFNNHDISLAGVKVESQQKNMTTTLQSAMDAAMSMDKPTIHLSEGIFKLGSTSYLPDNGGSYIGTKFKV